MDVQKELSGHCKSKKPVSSLEAPNKASYNCLAPLYSTEFNNARDTNDKLWEIKKFLTFCPTQHARLPCQEVRRPSFA